MEAIKRTMKKKLSISTIVLSLVVFSFFSWTTVQQDDFVFQKGNQKVALELENGIKYLKWNETAKLKISVENIPKSLSVYGRGLKLLKGSNATTNESIWAITPEKKYLTNDTLKITVVGKDLKDKSWTHDFKFLVK